MRFIKTGRQVLVAPLHPFLFAISPVVFILAQNLEEFLLEEATRALVVSLLFALILILITKLIMGEWHKAALISTGVIFLFFFYGHAHQLLGEISGPLKPGRHRYLIPIWIVLCGSWIMFVLKRLRDSTSMAGFLNVAGLLLLAFPLFSLTRYHLETTQLGAPTLGQESEIVSPEALGQGARSDIYYIIVDGYAGANVLADLYQHDNGFFIQELEQRSFYVADSSTSNYSQTALSLASSLNMEYVPNIISAQLMTTNNRAALAERIRHSRVRELLAAMAYQMIAFQTGYRTTMISDADHFWFPEVGTNTGMSFLIGMPNDFEFLLLQSTAGLVVLDALPKLDGIVPIDLFAPQYRQHRDRILYTFSMLRKVPELEGSYFVFAHLIAPHPPFVFGKNGEEVGNDTPFTLADGTLAGTTDEYITKYSNQLTYINKLLLQTIDEILKRSLTPPIIIIQGDHGPGAYLTPDSLADSNVRERMSILNAYFLPGMNTDLLYPTLTPVNSFRLIFNMYFGTSYELLEDMNYFSTWAKPYEFLDVTDQLR